MATKPLTCPFEFDVIISVTDMHTGGKTVRIVESGFPVPQGKTMWEKIEDLRKNYDDYRKLVLLEPRGFAHEFGALLVAPDNPEADLGVIFLHNEGYAPMCGHVCISLGRYAVDRGLVRRPITSPETQVNIQAPCGLIKTWVKVDPPPSRKTSRVRIENVPSFVVATDVEVTVKGIGTFQVDFSYGGGFYAFVAAPEVGLEFGKTTAEEFARTGCSIRHVIKDAIPLYHPDVPSFLFGLIFVEARDKMADGSSIILCTYADDACDRSPCGSGTSARLALMYHRGFLQLGQQAVFENPLTGSQFLGKAVRETTVGNQKAIVPEVEGQGYYCGKSTFYLEKGDAIGRGFHVL